MRRGPLDAKVVRWCMVHRLSDPLPDVLVGDLAAELVQALLVVFASNAGLEKDQESINHSKTVTHDYRWVGGGSNYMEDGT